MSHPRRERVVESQSLFGEVTFQERIQFWGPNENRGGWEATKNGSIRVGTPNPTLLDDHG